VFKKFPNILNRTGTTRTYSLNIAISKVREKEIQIKTEKYVTPME
jgi:hypothetical protein